MREDLARILSENKNGFWGNKGLLSKVEKYLKEEESVLYATPCLQTTNPVGKMKIDTFNFSDKDTVLFLITNERMLIYYKLLFDERVNPFPISEMREYHVLKNKMAMSTKFRISTLTNIIELSVTDKKLANELENLLSGIKQKNSNIAQHIEIRKDSIDKKEYLRMIEELSRLCDMGIISDKEFKDKKQDLLNRL